MFQQFAVNEFINFSSDDDEEENINLEYLYNLGLAHEKRGSPHDAIFYFDKVWDVEPDHINALSHKGNALGKLGKYDQAITCYDMVLKIKPDHTVCNLNKGLALHYLGRYDKALICYDKILEKSPDNPSVLYHKACTKSLQYDIEQALSLLEKTIILESEYAGKASRDMDFEPLQKDARFKALTM